MRCSCPRCPECGQVRLPLASPPPTGRHRVPAYPPPSPRATIGDVWVAALLVIVALTVVAIAVLSDL